MASDRDSDPEAGERLLTRATPYPTSRLGAKIELVDLAKEIQVADQAIGMVVGGKLDVIREQMRALQEQARTLLEEARASALLHRARCNFRKVPGGVYHLYKRPDGELYFSMLSPEDWGGAPPHPFEGSFRLEADLGFTPLGHARERVDASAVVARLLRGEAPAG